MSIRAVRDRVTRARARRGARLVLVLQGERAIWTRWRDGHCVEERVERTGATVPTGCPWPAEGEVFVDVVADSPHDDIERVLVASPIVTDRGPLVALRRQLLRMRLIRRHPEALVRMAPPALAPLVAVLLRAGSSDVRREYLRALEEGNLTVRTLHPAIGLPCPGEASREGDVLEIVRDEGTERHLLYRSGCPTFTRVVAVDDARAADSALAETLAHLAARHGVATPHVLRTEAADAARRLARLALGAKGGGAAAVESLGKWRAHVMLRRLRLSTMLTALIALVTFATAVVHGLDSARQRARAMAAEEALALRVDTLGASVAERHPTPALAAASLAFVEARESTRAPDADSVLKLLADVLTAHPHVRLERLAWSARAAGDETDDASFPRAASLSLWTGVVGEDEAPVDILVEMAGRIGAAEFDASPADLRDDTPEHMTGGADDTSPSLPVGERQRRFEAFVADLGRRDGVERLKVRLSPAAAASRDGAAEAPAALDFELRLRYARPG